MAFKITSSCARVVAALFAIVTFLYNRMELDFKLAGHLEIPLLFVGCLGRIVLRSFGGNFLQKVKVKNWISFYDALTVKLDSK